MPAVWTSMADSSCELPELYSILVPGGSDKVCSSTKLVQWGDLVIRGKDFCPPNSVQLRPEDIVNRCSSVISCLRASLSIFTCGKNAVIGVSGSGSSPLSIAIQMSEDRMLLVQELIFANSFVIC
ncbi:hypothetical protein D3C73_718520 [compost metagenome]